MIFGVDEAGRGPLAGPVVAAAVLLSKPRPPGLDDSKKLTAARRAELEATIKRRCQWAVGVVEVEDMRETLAAKATEKTGPGEKRTRQSQRGVDFGMQRRDAGATGLDEDGEMGLGPVQPQVAKHAAEQDNVAEIAAPDDEDARDERHALRRPLAAGRRETGKADCRRKVRRGCLGPRCFRAQRRGSWRRHEWC